MGDRDLGTELQKLCSVLASSPSSKVVAGAQDLEGRLEALRQLSKLARDDISRRHGFFSLMSTFVKVALQRHIEETRTVLSIEACAVVTAFAEHSTNRSAWQMASEWFVSSLLHATTHTTQVSVKAAVAALEALARTNSFGAGAFAELLRGCVARHAAARRHAFGALQLVIQQCRNNEGDFPLVKHIDAVCRVLRGGLVDADAEMRRCARRCYWAFHVTEPEAANVLYKGLEKPVKRALDRERVSSGREKKGSPSLAPQLMVKEARPQTVVREFGEEAAAAAAAAEGDVSQEGEPPNAVESSILVRDALQSTSWSQRLSGLRRFAGEFPHLHHKAECVKLLLPRLNDPNYRVSQAAIEVVWVVMRLSPTLFKDELPELITSLLVNVSRNKEGLSSASRELLAAVIQANSVDSVAHAIYRALGDVVTPKVKVHAVEYIQYLFTQNAGYFAQLAPMKLAVSQILLILQSDRRSGDLYTAVVSAFTTLYAVAKTAFFRALLQLSPDEHEAVVEALEITVPQLAQECRRRSWDERPLHHPPLEIRSPFAEALTRRGGTPPKSRTGPERPRTVCSSRAIQLTSTKKELTRPRARSVPRDEERRSEKKEDHRASAATAAASPSPDVPLTAHLSPSTRMSPCCLQHPAKTKTKVHIDATVASPRIMYEDDANALLDQLDAAYGVVDTCASLDRINNMMTTSPKIWMNAFGRLVSQLEKRVHDLHEPHHLVRCRSFLVLHTAVGSNSLRRPVCRSLKRILLLARYGIDDVFAEVQEKAKALLQVIFWGGVYSTDDCLNALAASLEMWLQDQSCHSSRGWLMLLESVECFFSRLGRSVVLLQSNTKENGTTGDFPPGVLSQPVLGRICAVAVRALQHTVSEVRLATVLLCVSIWMALDTAALPYFTDLAASQRKLLSIYFNKMISERMPELQTTMQRRDLSREMRVMGLPEATHL